MALIEGRVWRVEVQGWGTRLQTYPANGGRSKLLIVQADNFRDAVEQVMLAVSDPVILSCVKLDADGLIVPPAITQ